ncbi:MAG: glycosyl hydrolase, partial [Bacteroidota bacterium]
MIAIIPQPSFSQKTNFEEKHFDAMKWRLVGPFRGGRAGTAVGVANRTNLYYMGTAGGGVWKTEDGGNTWKCISDGYFGGSIGAVALAESDPNVIYVGEGEQTLRGNVSSGHGLWRSTDAGQTWSFIGLKDSEHIGRIRVHPQNPDLVYVAAIGNLWKPNDMRGVYRSKDGGKNWERILFESDKAGAVDIILDPNNPRIIYASTWQMKRNGYRMDSGGPGSKLWKSTDGGDTWKDITRNQGLPEGVNGIIGVTVSPLNSDRVWAIIENQQGGVFRSDDGGKTWKKTSTNRNLRQRAWYYSRIYADTKDEDRVYVCNVGFWVSKDGGNNFTQIRTPHGDHHDLWINPNDNNIMVVADDGGAQVSYDQGENWTTYHNQPTSQFYRVTTDNHFPFRIYGAQQDNSSIRINHRGKGGSISERDWEPSAGGESAHLAPDPENPDIVYGGTYKGYMMRLDHLTGQTRSTNVWPDNPAGSGAEVMKYRFNWNFPVAFSPHDPNKLYAGSNYLHVTYNEGQSWEVISPDLSRNDPETIKSSGGPITQDNTGAEFYANIFVITESPLEKDLIWIGTDDGKLWVTKDGGKKWNDVTPDGPKLNMMNCIDVHPTKEGVAYVAATSYKFGDYTPYLYKTTNYGKSWEIITDGIPENYYTRAIRADHKRDGLLYAGTEWGMYVSFNDGKNWVPFQLNLPITAIRDLHVRDNMLIAATHGRSFWMIDDLTPLQQLNEDIVNSDFFLFESKPAYRMAQA